MLSIIWNKTPTFVKWLLLVLVASALSFGIGYKLMPVEKTTVTVKDEDYTRQEVTKAIAAAREEWEKTTHTATTTTTFIKVPCPAPTTEPSVCKPPCATDCTKCPSQIISSTTTTTTDTTEHGKKDTTSTTETTSTTHDVKHETTTTTVKPADTWMKSIHVSGIASLSLLGDAKLTLTPSYGIGISKDIIGPLSLGASVYTDKTVLANVSLDLGKDWSVSAGAGMHFADISSKNLSGIFYGGSVDRRLLGPIWVGVWGYSDRSGGVSASFTIP